MEKLVRGIKLIPVIVKNLFLLAGEAIFNLARRAGAGRILLVLVILAVLGGGGYLGYKKIFPGIPSDPDEKLTLEDASRMGEMKRHKILVQISNPAGGSEDDSGRYERGDIVMAVPEDREFSDSEKRIFLIFKMDLTEKQADLLARSLQKTAKEKDPDGNPVKETLKRRKYAVDLSKMGIGGDVVSGRELDKVFKWDEVVAEKSGKEK